MAATTLCPTCSSPLVAPHPIILVTCRCGTRVRISQPNANVGATTPVDLYAVLGIDSTATPEDIRAAYRRRARETHPDAGGDATEFHSVQVAWEILGDPERRRNHDRGRRTGATGPVTVPDLLGVSVLVAVQRLATRGLTPQVMLHPATTTDPLHDLVIGQDPSPEAMVNSGSSVVVVVAGSDAGVIWRGLRRDADRVADQVRDSATEAATAAIDAGRRLMVILLRLVALFILIAVSVVLGVYDARTGLAVLVIGGAVLAWTSVRQMNRRSVRRRIRHRK